MHRLFIGGSMDGQFRDCLNSEPVAKVAVLPKAFYPMPLCEGAPFPTDIVDFEEETYHIKCINGKNKIHEFMLLQGLDSDNMLELLIKNYRGNNEIQSD